MSRIMTTTVRPSDQVAANTVLDQTTQNVVRHAEKRAKPESFERLKAELRRAFAALDVSYGPLTAAEVIARHER